MNSKQTFSSLEMAEKYRTNAKSLVIILLSIFFSAAERSNATEVAPAGNGQLEHAPSSIPGGTDDEGRSYSYLGQKESGGKLILTASNGFFTKGVAQAKGESKLPKVGDEELIAPNFEHLDWKSAEGSLRWYLHVENPGPVHFNVHLDAPNSGTAITATFGDESKSVKTSKSDHEKPQTWDLSYDVTEPGEYVFSLAADAPASGSTIGRLHRIEAFGPGIADSHLLRVRWRPAAVHGGYDTSKVDGVKLLVFTTSSAAPISSYSPITTPFGYYGTSFDGDRRSNGSFNFSMWGKEGASADLKMMPHLLGIGSPDGEFSGFGHEGSGVKPRGWDPMPDRPELVVQALRLVPGEEYDSYFGYYFDHPTKAWKFYCAGKKWHGGKSVSHLKLGSFCEVPGPPQVERTGDIYREVRRRAWAYDDGNWIPLEQYQPGGGGSKGDIPVNKRWYTTREGEYAMGCGGIRLYRHEDSWVESASVIELPYFLTSNTTDSLFKLPIEYGAIQASEISSDSATIEFDITSANEIKNAFVHYGTRDALTFAPRELHGTEKKSELSQAVNEQSWQKSAEIFSLRSGVNQIELGGLEPSTTYFYRILTTDSASRIWNNDTLTFTTPETGEPPITQSPLQAGTTSSTTTANKFEEEPYRTWNYQIGTSKQQLEGRLIGISGKKIQIERKSDGKKGTMDLELFSKEDREYIGSKR